MFERIRSLGLTFHLLVTLPTALAVVYFGFLAEDVYISESRFVVRSPKAEAASPIAAALSRTGFGAVDEGNSVVIEYLGSRQAVEEANRDHLLVRAYGGEDVFWLDRFGLWGANSREQLYRYVTKKLSVNENPTTRVVTIAVRAFAPKDAQQINARLLAQSEKLVNGLSRRAQADMIALAQEQLDEAKQAARAAELELAAYRDRKGIVDPQAESEVGLQMISKLQDELIATQTRLRQLETYTPQASQIPFLRTQARELQNEIEAARRALIGGRKSLSSAMARFQELKINAQFAEKQLGYALAAYEDARAEARRQRAYVETVARPSLPDYAVEPRRLRSIFATLVLGLIAWGVVTMLMIGIREHRN